jgi:hypothetical protein
VLAHLFSPLTPATVSLLFSFSFFYLFFIVDSASSIDAVRPAFSKVLGSSKAEVNASPPLPRFPALRQASCLHTYRHTPTPPVLAGTAP